MDFMVLDRTLLVFDIESTGVNPRADRIIELAAIRIHPNGARDSRDWLLNPGVPIPMESTAIHGIEDEHVRNCPKFSDVADEINEYFLDCDLAGFNHTRFDIPLLVEEFYRVGKHFEQDSRRIIDAQRIFHTREPRDLTAAVKFYCDEEFTDAHGAVSDAQATLRVLEGQFKKYPDLPRDPDKLDAILNERDPFNVDRAGRLKWMDGEIAINFGKKQGQLLRDLIKTDAGYVNWILTSDFPRDTKDIIRAAQKNRWPRPPAIFGVEKEESREQDRS